MAFLERVVILSVSAGAGHMRAAAALKAAVLETNPQAGVIILDTFRYTSPLLEKVMLGTYMEMLKITPVVYGYLYRQAESGQPLSGFAKQEFSRILNKLTAPKLVQFLRQHQPQLVVCTHPFPVGILDRLKEQDMFNVPLVATITDFTVHPFWVFPGVDAYTVADRQLGRLLEEQGIAPAKIHAAGIPIDPSFARPVNRRAVRAGLGLADGLPAVLVMGGGLGMGPLADVVQALGNSDVRCQIMVVAGSNEQLRAKLERIAGTLQNPVRVFGFIQNIHELMSAADLMVGKAGGLTCAEALAKGLPMFISDPLPGQEERNAQFLQQAGAALQVDGTRELVAALTACLSSPQRLRLMSAAAARLGRPQAARATLELLTGLLENGEAGRETYANEFAP
ncbi:MGDG synthase family glycosyltransferase [Desulfotomaculum copahuensis]|uniref:Galactosyldiacylglycerol synthase n=1 Tax=Desulfotomaculum copahuensis TaxID=1838280 RepID=A0A1B7LHV3_9FIRM|nr:glycosyltransferase [Desulfotomaculum copahuensis]OAT85862.1 galactosyldiacylglycerol synthase [Desulfotomaculum copahuensis]